MDNPERIKVSLMNDHDTMISILTISRHITVKEVLLEKETMNSPAYKNAQRDFVVHLEKLHSRKNLTIQCAVSNGMGVVEVIGMNMNRLRFIPSG
ncbi:hypothetical protein PINS_up013198 [Pythium insidiosum]|nr:hypothetical protein PINS_up013198 [Pythium insidiosum]